MGTLGRRALVCAGLLLLTACFEEELPGPGGDAGVDAGPGNAGPDAGPDAGPADAGPDAGPGGTTRTVFLGARDVHHLEDGGTLVRPRDVAAMAPRILVPQADGGYVAYTDVRPSPDGGVAVLGVPAGTYMLEVVGSEYLVLAAPEVMLSRFRIGRPDVQRTDAGTRLGLSLSGLEPWEEGDDLHVTSVGAGLTSFPLVDGWRLPVPPAGSTTLEGSVEYRRMGSSAASVEPAKGDRLVVHQMTRRTTPQGQAYQAAASALTLSDYATVDGATSTATGLLQPLPQQVLTVDLRGQSFAAQHAALGPGVSFASLDLYVDQVPSQYHAGFRWPPDLVNLEAPALADGGVPALGVQTLSYGRPLSTGWGDVASVWYRGEQTFTPELTDGGTYTVTYNSGLLSYTDTVAGLQAAPVTLRLSPPRALAVAGQPAGGPMLRGVGLTPELTWDAPEVGVPTYYVVWVQTVDPEYDVGFAFYTYERRLRLPPGLLRPGVMFFAQVDAVLEPGAAPLHAGAALTLPRFTSTLSSPPMLP